MKKTLLPVIAMAMLLSSCSKNEMVDATAATSTPIGFSSYMGTTTKGAATDINTFKAFKVNAYHTMAEIAAVGAKTQYITAGDVTCPSDTWTSADYFWPTTGNLSFYAYAPATDVVTYNAATAETMPSITYTTLADAASQADVVVAATLNQTYANADAAVAMAFTHALTRVNFSATGADNAYNYNVTSLEVSNVLPNGTYTFGETPTWNVSGTAIKCNYMATDASVAVNATIATPLNPNAAASLMLIPQDASAITVTIAYTVSNGSTEISNNTAVVTTLTETWVAGQNIRYNIKLTTNGKKITFKPSVTDWNKETTPDVTPAK